MSHFKEQEEWSDLVFAGGSRAHVLSSDPATQYIVSWRVKKSIQKLMSMSNGRITFDSRVLCMCSGEGLEGSILCDMGFKDVTVSDLSENGVKAATDRDGRLNAVVLNAQESGLKDNAYDVVLVQDGLHHLPSPVHGFVEMLRIASVGTIFLEPHDSLVGKKIGREWEVNHGAVTYVFRWNKGLVQQISSSYLGRDSFYNLSFSFWHHNLVYARVSKKVGSALGLPFIKAVKCTLDTVIGKKGNQFAGIVLKK